MDSYTLEYASQPTTVIAFILHGEQLRPDEVTQALGVTPTQAWEKGQARRGGVPYRTGYWVLEPDGSPYEPFDSQLTRLLDQLDRLPTVLHDYIAQFEAGISVGHATPSENFGFHLDQQTMHRLGRLGVSLDFDLYVHSQAEEQDTSTSEVAV